MKSVKFVSGIKKSQKNQKKEKPLTFDKKWKPSTTKKDVENILKNKNIKLNTRQKSQTKIKINKPVILKVGDKVPYFTGTCTLQRYIHKTQRWRVKLEDGSVDRLTTEQISFLKSCTNKKKKMKTKKSTNFLEKIMRDVEIN